MGKIVLALGCHPDDIEFMMSGTLFLLKEAGCEIHYMNLANGNCGTADLSYRRIVNIRKKEAQAASTYLGAFYHQSLSNDIEVFYEDKLIKRVASIIRQIKPDIILLPSLEDYMEDHMNTAKIGVTAAFCKGMLNYRTIPLKPPIYKDVFLYHALPYGLKDGMNKTIIPSIYIDVTTVMERKEKMLGYHLSQKEWLDKSQGLNAYIKTMIVMTGNVGTMSKKFKFAEGWRMHSFLGFSTEGKDLLSDTLDKKLVKNI